MKKSISVIVLLLLSVNLMYAQTELTLNDAISFALKHKAEAVKAKLDVKNADYLIEEVKASALPSLNGSAGLTYNAILQKMALDFGGQTQIITMGQPWNSNVGLQLQQQLFNMSVFQGLKAAKSTKDFYAINAELTEEQIVEKVANSYYEVFRTKSQLKTLDQTIENTTRVRDVIASLEKNGLAKKIDLDRMNVTLNNIVSSRQQLLNGLTLQQNALKYLIGMNISEEIALPANTFDEPTQMYAKEDINLANRTEIKLLEQQGLLLQLNKKATEASRYPTLSLGANYAYSGIGNQFPIFNQSSSVNWFQSSAIGLTLNVPIFNGFRIRSKINQAQIDIDKFEADLKDTKLALNLANENAYTQINNSLITINSQKSNMVLAEKVLKNVENNYKNGLASLTDLLDAENSYVNAQNNYINALLDYKLAEVQLIKAKGELKSYYTNSK